MRLERRRRLGLPDDATDEVCDRHEERRQRLSLPLDATEDDCLVQETLLQLQKEDQLRARQRALMQLRSSHCTQDKLDALVAWLQRSGAVLDGVSCSILPDSTGVGTVTAVRTIPKQHEFIRIPLKCIITDDVGRQTPNGQRLLEVEDQLSVPNHCQIIVFMMMGVDGAEFFQPYFDVLPRNFGHYPTFWTEAELEWLKGSELVPEIRRRKRAMGQDYRIICKATPCCLALVHMHTYCVYCATPPCPCGSSSPSLLSGGAWVCAKVCFRGLSVLAHRGG